MSGFLMYHIFPYTVGLFYDLVQIVAVKDRCEGEKRVPSRSLSKAEMHFTIFTGCKMICHMMFIFFPRYEFGLNQGQT